MTGAGIDRSKDQGGLTGEGNAEAFQTDDDSDDHVPARGDQVGQE